MRDRQMIFTKKPTVASLLASAGVLALAACGDMSASSGQEGDTSAGADAAAADQSVASYDAAEFFQTTSYYMAGSAGHAFSPDGTAILVSSDETGIFNAMALPVDGSEKIALTESTTDSTFASSYFPQDDRILFSRDSGGNEISHVFLRETDGTVTDLTPGEETRAIFMGWADDDQSFFVQTNERDAEYLDLYRYGVDGYEREMMYQNDDGGYAISAVSGDGRYVALGKERTSADSDIYLADLTTDEPPEHITPHEGNIAYGTYAFTPDNTQLVYATDEFGEFNQAWTYDLDTGDKAELITADWDVSFVTYSPSGRYRVHGINEDARTAVTILDTQTGAPIEGIDLPAGDIGNVRFSHDETRMAFMLSSDTAPNNAMVADLQTGAVTQLTDALNPAIDEADLVESEIVRYESFDGLEIPSVLYVPHSASADNPAPALVWVHGGPGGQTRTGYSATIQHLVNHGYVVLGANNRGSSGYGKTFYHMDDRKHGDVDLQDIVHGKTWLAEQDYVDAEKIGIIGGSYGGYMVGAALAFEPEVFEVGVNIFGVMNWVRTLDSIPPWWASFREALYDEMGDPATDAERHRAISPLFHADNIQVPLLVVQGANDPRVLKVESDEIVEAVRENGVPVEYLVFEDEGHGFSKRENRIAASNAYVSFLDEYLKGGWEPEETGMSDAGE